MWRGLSNLFVCVLQQRPQQLQLLKQNSTHDLSMVV